MFSGTFPGRKPGIFAIFAVFAGDVAPRLGDLIGRNVDHQFAGAVRVENRPLAVFFAAS